MPEGFHVTLVAGEPDVVQPIAIAIDDRGRLWVAEAYTYPVRAPEASRQGPHPRSSKTPTATAASTSARSSSTGLNLVSGLEVGFGGVWVGAAPYLLFIPDKNGDDVPDGAAARCCSTAGATQDTHETLNAFIWGPDGWLYGCHGVFTHSNVGKPGTPDDERVPHQRRRLALSSRRGTSSRSSPTARSNPWGLDFDDYGQAFITACVIPHLYHIDPGRRYERQAATHFNPYTYDDIKTIADHRHYVGNHVAHDGQPPPVRRRSAAATPTAGAMIYLGGAWPERVPRHDLHEQHPRQPASTSTCSSRKAPASSATTARLPPRQRPVVADAQPALRPRRPGLRHRLVRQECSAISTNPDRIRQTLCRVFTDSGTRRDKWAPVDLQKRAADQLVELQLHRNDWFVQHARRILQERGPGAAPCTPGCSGSFVRSADPTRKLRALWALHVTDGLREDDLAHDSPAPRANTSAAGP